MKYVNDKLLSSTVLKAVTLVPSDPLAEQRLEYLWLQVSQKENEEEEERMTMLMKIMMMPMIIAARTILMFRQSYMVTCGAYFGGTTTVWPPIST